MSVTDSQRRPSIIRNVAACAVALTTTLLVDIVAYALLHNMTEYVSSYVAVAGRILVSIFATILAVLGARLAAELIVRNFNSRIIFWVVFVPFSMLVTSNAIGYLILHNIAFAIVVFIQGAALFLASFAVFYIKSPAEKYNVGLGG